MQIHSDKTTEKKSQLVANAPYQKEDHSEPISPFVDMRQEAITQRKLQALVGNSNASVQKVQQHRNIEDASSIPPKHVPRGTENLSETPNQVTQLYHGYKADYESDFYYVKAIFRQRIADKTATTGTHNYAYNLDTKEISKSGTSGHAEILLLSQSAAVKGDSVTLISEYKPCKTCQAQIQRIEEARGIEVKVIWLIDYEEKGDGDTAETRDFYKSKKWLIGGGDYVYQVNPDDSGYKE